MLPLIVIPLAFDLSSSVARAFLTADWVIWAVFAAELAVKTYLAPERRRYLIRHWFDVLIVVIPFLRPLRIVRSARGLRLLRLGRMAAFLSRMAFTWGQVFGRRGLGYVLAVGLVAVVAIAGLVVIVEHDSAAASVDDFPTALWWSATTVTTVGYGDTAPVTAVGRGLGVLLMFVGIGVFGIFTANVAAFFVEEEGKSEGERREQELLVEIRALREEVRALRQSVGVAAVEGGGGS